MGMEEELNHLERATYIIGSFGIVLVVLMSASIIYLFVQMKRTDEHFGNTDDVFAREKRTLITIFVLFALDFTLRFALILIAGNELR